MRRLLVIGIVFAIAQQTTGCNVVQYYAPTVLANTGFTQSASLLASVAIGILLIVATLVGMWLLGFMPRRKMCLYGFGGVVVSHLGLALSFMCLRAPSGTTWSSSSSWLWMRRWSRSWVRPAG